MQRDANCRKRKLDVPLLNGRGAERLCENSRDYLNDGMISAFGAEAFHGAVYRRHRPESVDIVASVS